MRRAASGSLKGKTTAPSRTPRGRPALPGTGTGRCGVAGLGGVDAEADRDGVVGAVVAALGLGEALLAGNGASGAEGVHGGLGAGVGEADEVEAGDALAEELGQAYLVTAGGIVDDASVELLPDGLYNRGGRVA